MPGNDTILAHRFRRNDGLHLRFSHSDSLPICIFVIVPRSAFRSSALGSPGVAEMPTGVIPQDHFALRAQQLLDTARRARGDGGSLTVLIGRDGGIQMLSASDWPLDSLLRERGARAAYRVTSDRQTVRVEGRQDQLRCLLEAPWGSNEGYADFSGVARVPALVPESPREPREIHA
jgi:hypothetical protein